MLIVTRVPVLCFTELTPAEQFHLFARMRFWDVTGEGTTTRVQFLHCMELGSIRRSIPGGDQRRTETAGSCGRSEAQQTAQSSEGVAHIGSEVAGLEKELMEAAKREEATRAQV